MNAETRSFGDAFTELHRCFFAKFPDNDLRDRMNQADFSRIRADDGREHTDSFPLARKAATFLSSAGGVLLSPVLPFLVALV